MKTLEQITDSDVPFDTRKGTTCIGKAVHVHDGDTLRIVILDSNRPTKLTCRMHGYDSPELRTCSEACTATNLLLQQVSDTPVDFDVNKQYTVSELKGLLDANKRLVRVEFLGPDKYHRELVKLYASDGDTCINTLLTQHTFNKPYYGGKR